MEITRGLLKKTLNAPRPSEHPPLMGKMSKRLGGIMCCKCKTSSRHLNGFSFPMVVILDQLYNVGEKPTFILYTYIDLVSHFQRIGFTPEKKKDKR